MSLFNLYNFFGLFLTRSCVCKDNAELTTWVEDSASRISGLSRVSAELQNQPELLEKCTTCLAWSKQQGFL